MWISNPKWRLLKMSTNVILMSLPTSRAGVYLWAQWLLFVMDFVDLRFTPIFNPIFWYNYYFQVASKNLRNSEAVLVRRDGSLIDARILCQIVKKSCINHYIIAYNKLINCLLYIFQQHLNKKRGDSMNRLFFYMLSLWDYSTIDLKVASWKNLPNTMSVLA